MSDVLGFFREAGVDAALARPGGSETWYHGTQNEYDGVPDDYAPESAYGERAEKHWNTDLGSHWTSHKETAHDFALGVSDDDGYGATYADPTIPPRVAHAKLELNNPKRYHSEYEMSSDAIQWAHRNGHTYANHYKGAGMHLGHLRDGEYPEHLDYIGDHVGHADDFEDSGDEHSHLRHSIADIDEGRLNHTHLRSRHADTYLQLHPDRGEIVEGFKEHLERIGHDGVVYGNEIEGPHLHPCAIAFHPHQVKMTKWEHVDPKDPYRTAKEAAKMAAAPPAPLRYSIPGRAGMGGSSATWYHGTPSKYSDDEDEDRPSPPDRSGDEYGTHENKHWNTDLGVHFTSHKPTAHGFADVANPFSGVAHEPRIAHAHLHIGNPKHYESEFDMTNHAIKWAHENGYRYSKHFDHQQLVDGEVDDDAYGYLNAHEKETRAELSKIDKGGPGMSDEGWRDQYLAAHPDREEITEGFRRHLEKKGHDGVTYGNEMEGPKRHLCAIAFHPDQIHLKRWQKLSDPSPEGEDHPSQTQLTYHSAKAPLLHRGVSVDVNPENITEAYERNGMPGVHQHLADLATHQSLGSAGTHWSSDPEVARQFAHGVTSDVRTTLSSFQMRVPVVLHAHIDPEYHETDPEKLRDAFVQGHGYNHSSVKSEDERETLVKPGAPLRITHVEAALPSTPDWHQKMNDTLDSYPDLSSWKSIPHSWQTVSGASNHHVAGQVAAQPRDLPCACCMGTGEHPCGHECYACDASGQHTGEVCSQGQHDGEPLSYVHGHDWLPSARIFGPGHGDLDSRLFDGTKMKPIVRESILDTLDHFWGDRYPGWPSWSRVYLAGSEASEWYGNNDFDTLIGIEHDKFRESNPQFAKRGDIEIDEMLTAEFRTGVPTMGLAKLNNPDEHPVWDPEQSWDHTWYVNPNSWDIREIKPYAAYDITNDRWAVEPVHVGADWSAKSLPESFWDTAEAILAYIKAVQEMPEPIRTREAATLFDHLHGDRRNAFGPDGTGVFDPGNVLWKYLDMHPDKPLEFLVQAKHDVETGRKTASSEDDYRMQHTAPGPDNAPGHDLTGNGTFPEDVYTHPHYYDSGHETFYEAHAKVSSMRGKPDKKVRVYRALPAEHVHKGFQTGDWVALTKGYARDHGKMDDPADDWPVISTTVKASEIHNDGNDLNEWGYNGSGREASMPVYSGGKNQRVRQHADGVVRKVKPRYDGPSKGYTITHEAPGEQGARGAVHAYDPDGNHAGHLEYGAEGVRRVEVDPEHQHLDIEERLRDKYQSVIKGRKTAYFDDHDEDDDGDGPLGGQDWSEIYDGLPDTVHRGVGVSLPDHVHHLVHDENRPTEERARALLRHLGDSAARGGYDSRSGLGTRWSGNAYVAEDFAESNAKHATDADHETRVANNDHTHGSDEDGRPIARPGTAVVFHAHKPNLDDINEDPSYDGAGQHYTYHGHGEQEVPVHEGASMGIHSVSWRPVYHLFDPRGDVDDEEYTHHHFDEPQHHEARKQATRTTHPLENPYHGHDEWYHGSGKDLSGGMDSHPADSKTYHRPGKGLGGPQMNQVLGSHFSSLHSVAYGFTSPGYGERPSTLVHARLHFSNPAAYEDEQHLNVAMWKWASANHPGLHDEAVNDRYRGSYGHDSHDIERHVQDADKSGKVWKRNYAGEKAEHFFKWHPEQRQIAEGFVQHLADKGHHGIVYGNEVEGPTRHYCAIATHPSQIEISSIDRIRGHDHPEVAAGLSKTWKQVQDEHNEPKDFLRAVRDYHGAALERPQQGKGEYRYQAKLAVTSTKEARSDARLSAHQTRSDHGELAPERAQQGEAPDASARTAGRGRQRGGPGGGGDGAGPGGDGRDGAVGDGQGAPRPVTLHPAAERDLKKLDPQDRKRVSQTIDALGAGDPTLQTHALVGRLKGWYATKVSRGHRIVHQPRDGGHHVGYIGLHDYGDAINRLAGAVGQLPEGLGIRHEPEWQWSQDRVSAHHGGREVGWLSWRNGVADYGSDRPVDSDEIGRVGAVEVHPEYRRRGVATALWEHARKIEPRLHHSEALSDDGEAWSRKTAGPQGDLPATTRL